MRAFPSWHTFAFGLRCFFSPSLVTQRPIATSGYNQKVSSRKQVGWQSSTATL